MAAEILPYAPRRSEEAMQVKPGRILVTSRSSTARFDDLILPVIQALSPDRCTVLYRDPKSLQRLPSGANAIELDAGHPP